MAFNSNQRGSTNASVIASPSPTSPTITESVVASVKKGPESCSSLDPTPVAESSRNPLVRLLSTLGYTLG